MTSPRLSCLLILLSLSLSRPAIGADQAGAVQRVPVFRQNHVVMTYPETADRRYLAFPAVIDLGDDVLISYKRTRSHGGDNGSMQESIRMNGLTGAVSELQVMARLDGAIMQSGEWVRFPNGDLGNYIDTQQTDPANVTTRIGARFVRSTDGGHTFGPVERIGVVDGVEYGYPFEFITEGKETWMLVMTFSSLTGGKAVIADRPKSGSVDVLHSTDNGRTWHFVRNLSREFGGVSINESTFIRHGDGFLVSTRGYDNTQRLHKVDAKFNLIRQINLTGTYSFIKAHVGRPRLFVRDGKIYLIGRNTTQSPPKSADPAKPAARMPMQLCLFRIEPDRLAISAYSILDNAENAPVSDGYYAVPYFRTVDGKTRLNIITYKGVNKQPPDIVRFEYVWDEVR